MQSRAQKSPSSLVGLAVLLMVVTLVFELIFDDEVNWVVVIGSPIAMMILLVVIDRDWIRRQ